jgi:hypothetical protein
MEGSRYDEEFIRCFFVLNKIVKEYMGDWSKCIIVRYEIRSKKIKRMIRGV